MRTSFKLEDFSRSVVAVPPLCRDAQLRVVFVQNQRLIQHLESGGVRILLYGGNANFYNISLREHSAVLDTLEAASGPDTLVIPSVGPYYGTLMDQAEILADREFPTAMVLPTIAVSSPEGVRAAFLRFVERFGKPAVLYIKDSGYVTVEVARSLVDAGAISWIKYAVVRTNPANDPLLKGLCDQIDPRLIVSGIGEQPAVVHVPQFQVGGFTSGCVCVAPRLSMDLLDALRHGDAVKAESLRQIFLPLETLRNSHGPIPVLHHAIALAGLADTGPLLPLLSPLNPSLLNQIAPVAEALLAEESSRRNQP